MSFKFCVSKYEIFVCIFVSGDLNFFFVLFLVWFVIEVFSLEEGECLKIVFYGFEIVVLVGIKLNGMSGCSLNIGVVWLCLMKIVVVDLVEFELFNFEFF